MDIAEQNATGRHRVGHTIFVYHRDPDDNIIEFYTELDLMKEEELGFWEPRPWHLTNPQRPRGLESTRRRTGVGVTPETRTSGAMATIISGPPMTVWMQ